MIRSFFSPTFRTFIILLSIVLIQLVFFKLFYLSTIKSTVTKSEENKTILENLPDWEKTLNFTGFNNETGTPDGHYIIPNYVHFIKFHFDHFNFIHFICVLAAFKHQRPERLFIHTDVERFQGKYWEILLQTPGFTEVSG